MIVDLLRPVYVAPKPGGWVGAAQLACPSDTILFPGECDGAFLLDEMGRRDFQRHLSRGVIVPKGCEKDHAKVVLYGTVYCYTCGWLT